MPELLQEMYYGPNVQNLIESDDCKVMRLSDNFGEGMMTLYHVFPGVFLMYNDFHMKECISGFQTDMDLLCIDHCREGRIEQEVGQNAFSYLEAGGSPHPSFRQSRISPLPLPRYFHWLSNGNRGKRNSNLYEGLFC